MRQDLTRGHRAALGWKQKENLWEEAQAVSQLLQQASCPAGRAAVQGGGWGRDLGPDPDVL